jgi:PhzF family phenazine biosynthesis protein
MDIPFFQVDAFTKLPYAGNPAAVCILDAWPDNESLRKIADENNLSETAFVVAEDDVYGLRWFTPKAEVPLCGHGTLATAHILLNRDGTDRVVFRTLSGDLPVERDGDAYRMDFPALPPQPCGAPTGIAGALGTVPDVCFVNALTHVAVFRAESDVADLEPNMRAVEDLPLPYLVATAPGTGDVDFVSRFFAPGVGVPEDPVTGSAHCVLAPLWAARLGKERLHARQISRRGGDMICEVAEDRVFITGHAFTVIEGMLHLPI